MVLISHFQKEAKVQKKSDDDQVPYLLDQRGLDDLVRYINGYDDSNWAKSTPNTEKSSTTKAAKRKKQKQRKVRILLIIIVFSYYIYFPDLLNLFCIFTRQHLK